MRIKLSRDWLTRTGFWFGLGCIQAWGICFVIGLGAAWAASAFGLLSTDATDKSPVVRSGMALRTDYGTGCQYLVSGNAMTPRLDAEGLPICGKDRP